MSRTFAAVVVWFATLVSGWIVEFLVLSGFGIARYYSGQEEVPILWSEFGELLLMHSILWFIICAIQVVCIQEYQCVMRPAWQVRWIVIQSVSWVTVWSAYSIGAFQSYAPIFFGLLIASIGILQVTELHALRGRPQLSARTYAVWVYGGFAIMHLIPGISIIATSILFWFLSTSTMHFNLRVPNQKA